MKDRIAAEILAAHADRLNQGYQGLAAVPAIKAEQGSSLYPLMRLAERVQGALVPVQPDPAFVRQLGKQLAATANDTSRVAAGRTRRTVMFGAAVLGSAVSLASAVGLVVYLLRQRGRLRSQPAT